MIRVHQDTLTIDCSTRLSLPPSCLAAELKGVFWMVAC